ncbi:hypothetical protein BJ912DRAFT_671098 [Pholiota molesta]|nr:hypothetical protein BJ912DRAFT_671098 [Pholiota molesta]
MVFSNGGKFNLDVSGIAGFFGGEESSAAMASVNLVRARPFVGWYNSPGSYFVAKVYGMIAGTRFWDGLFPGRDLSPAAILGLDGQHGPRFIGSQSATRIEMTGHLAYLLFSYCTDLKPSTELSTELSSPTSPLSNKPSQDGQENGLHDRVPEVHARNQAIASPSAKYLYSLALVPDLVEDAANTTFEQSVTPMTNDLLPLSWHGLFAAFVTIAFSIAAAVVAAAKWHDAFGCIAISIGIVCNGCATLVYGSGTLSLHTPTTRQNAPPGDGIMVRDNDMVILRGPESAQLVLLPAATLKGQIIFLATFVLSWCHNAYLASIDRERLQCEALRQKLGLTRDEDKAFRKAPFERWASMVAASAFYLKPTNTDDWLRQLIPNNTPVWDEWRRRIVAAVECHSTNRSENKNQHVSFVLLEDKLRNWDEINRKQLQGYLNDAEIGYRWCTDK